MKLKFCNNDNSVFGIDDNGNYISYSIESDEYKQWLSEGNTPEPEFTEEELAQQAKDKQIAEAKAYLSSTDYKFTADYDKDTTEVKVKRAEARAIIRSLEGN